MLFACFHLLSLLTDYPASELATYDEIKHQLVSRGIVSSGSSLSGHVLASLAAGAISTVAINPFDVAKR